MLVTCTAMRCTSPGGAVPLLDAAGKDGTKLFYSLHRGSVLDRYVFRVEQCAVFKIK